METGAETAVLHPSPGTSVETAPSHPTKGHVESSSTPLAVDLAVTAASATASAMKGGSSPAAVVLQDGGDDAPPSPRADASVPASAMSPGGSRRTEDAPQAAVPMEELPEETKAALVKQVEFYFSDENLPTDPFMKKKIKAGGTQGWVPLKVICNFSKVKKLSKDLRAISHALEGSEVLVVSKGTRVRRKTPFKFPDKDGMSDVIARTVVAVNIPAASTVESLTPFFSACGVAETIRVVRKNKQDKTSEIQAPVGPNRDLYATCQFSTLEEAIRAVNELTDRKSWRGGLRVSLANGMTVEKALAKLKTAASKKARQEQKDKVNYRSSIERRGDGNARDGQMRSRSLTELELESTAGATNGGGGGGGGGGREKRASPLHRRSPADEEGGSSGGDRGEGAGADMETGTASRKPRSVSNVDALSNGVGGGGGGVLDGSPRRHDSAGDGLPRKGVVQTLSSEGWSWIKKDGSSRKGGNRIPFALRDVMVKDGEQQTPLQKGDHVEYRAWRDSEGRLMAVRVERAKEKPRPGGGVGSSGGGSGTRAAQAHFRMAVGPEEGHNGFAAGRGRPIAVEPPPPPSGRGGSGGGGVVGGGNEVLRRPRGSSMGGVDSKVFVPSTAVAAAAEAAAAAAAAAAVPPVAPPVPHQFEDAD